MGDVGDYWREAKAAGYKHKRYKPPFDYKPVEKDMTWLAKRGIEGKWLTPYQVRFNDTIDIWPPRQKYHNIKKNIRGTYENLREFLIKELNQ